MDDPKNFQRAFGQPPPKEVKIVHSYYWLSPHFTHEHVYFFEIESASNVLRMLTNGLPLAFRPDAKEWRRPNGNDIPKWFMAKGQSAYEVWTWKTNANEWRSFLLVRDKADGRLFIYDEQL